jgi:hypothetical protein
MPMQPKSSSIFIDSTSACLLDARWHWRLVLVLVPELPLKSEDHAVIQTLSPTIKLEHGVFVHCFALSLCERTLERQFHSPKAARKET